MSTKRKFASLTLIFSLLVVGISYAQTTATIEGTVVDETSAVIPGVTITAVNVGTGATRTAVSNDLGRYVISSLPVGGYEVRAELTGFSTQARGGIQFTVGQAAQCVFSEFSA